MSKEDTLERVAQKLVMSDLDPRRTHLPKSYYMKLAQAAYDEVLASFDAAGMAVVPVAELETLKLIREQLRNRLPTLHPKSVREK